MPGSASLAAGEPGDAGDTTRPRFSKVFEALGTEVVEIVDGKIKELRDYHRPLPARAD